MSRSPETGRKRAGAGPPVPSPDRDADLGELAEQGTAGGCLLAGRCDVALAQKLARVDDVWSGHRDVPFESAVEGSLERSRDGRVLVRQTRRRRSQRPRYTTIRDTTLAAALDSRLGVLRPQTQAALRRPETMQHQHVAERSVGPRAAFSRDSLGPPAPRPNKPCPDKDLRMADCWNAGPSGPPGAVTPPPTPQHEPTARPTAGHHPAFSSAAKRPHTVRPDDHRTSCRPRDLRHPQLHPVMLDNGYACRPPGSAGLVRRRRRDRCR